MRLLELPAASSLASPTLALRASLNVEIPDFTGTCAAFFETFVALVALPLTLELLPEAFFLGGAAGTGSDPFLVDLNLPTVLDTVLLRGITKSQMVDPIKSLGGSLQIAVK